MSSTAANQEVTTEEMVIAPFGIEIDHPRNDDVMLQSIPGTRLRSAIDGTKGSVNARGEYVIPLDQSMGMASMPKTPGQQIHVNPKARVYAIVDPLNGDESGLDRLNKFLKNKGIISRDSSVRGVPKVEGTLDPHRMKTLLREIFWLVRSKEAKVVQGRLPDLEDIEELPGNFLLNPGSRVQNTQPQFEKDWDDYLNRLQASGG